MSSKFLTAFLAVFFFGLTLLFFQGSLRDLLERAESSVAHHQLTYVGPRYLDQYTIGNLQKRPFAGSDFRVERPIADNVKYTTGLFSFRSRGRKVSGALNVPNGAGPFPTILMIRGYVDPKNYRTGVGTERAAAVFAEKGYLTLAPDFFGYGESDPAAPDDLEDRFQTYTTLLDLYGLLPKVASADPGRVYLWAHSNGGQIALTFLEITRKPIPTVLWAPVSKSFPYSILYFMDEFPDQGKALLSLVAKFESLYDPRKYSLTDHLSWLSAPILLQQGTDDGIVLPAWSDELAKSLRRQGKDLVYLTYDGADHNLSGHWSEAVADDEMFFASH